MRYIKIFLASALTNFEYEQYTFERYIRSLNNIYAKKEICFELTVCNDLGSIINKGNFQEKYYKIIQESQYFYVLFDANTGKYILKEIGAVLNDLKVSETPKIYACACLPQLPDNLTAGKNILNFMEDLKKQFGYSYCIFSHLDSIKLQMLLELTEFNIEFKDGQVLLNGRPVIPLKNIPLYSKNKALQVINTEQNTLQEDYDCLAADYVKNPNDIKLENSLNKIVSSLKYLTEKSHELEDHILTFYQYIIKARNRKDLSGWENIVFFLMETGNYEKAEAFLRNIRQADISSAQTKADAVKERIHKNIALINFLIVRGAEQECSDEIEVIYKETLELAGEYGINMNSFYDPAYLLYFGYLREIAKTDHYNDLYNALFESYNQQQSSFSIMEKPLETIVYECSCPRSPQTEIGLKLPNSLAYSVSFDANGKNLSKASNIELKKVQFSAVAPNTIVKGDYTIINIIMYEELFRYVVDELIQEANTPLQEKKSGIHKVAAGAKVKIILTSADIKIRDNKSVQVWSGGYLNFSFAVFLPQKYKKHQVLFNASVYINDVIATRLNFITECSSPARQNVPVIRKDIFSAFISYASQDRKRVATIIQGMKKARPDMDVFFDVDNLRSGENWEDTLSYEIEKRDILFLCWSHFARQSKWVDKEWRYALSHKGIDSIEPIPLESPELCPPPEELKKKHFNDKLLYIINDNGNELA